MIEEILKVNLLGYETYLTRKELNDWLIKNPTDSWYIISSSWYIIPSNRDNK